MALYPDIFNGVTAQLATLARGVNSWFGPDNLHRQEAPPRIIWEPTSDSFGPPSQRGSSRADPIARATVRTAVNIHVWGADWAATMALRDAFAEALRQYLGPNYHLTGGQWIGNESTTSLGRLYVLSFFVDVPMTDPVPVAGADLVTITSEDQTDAAFSH